MNPVQKYHVKCAVPGSDDITSSRLLFPLQLDLLEKWCNAVKNLAITPYDISRNRWRWRICCRHFADDDKMPKLRRKIKHNAVPVLHLAGCKSQALENCVSSPTKTPRLPENVEENQNIEVSSSSIHVAEEPNVTPCYSGRIRVSGYRRFSRKLSTSCSGPRPKRSILSTSSVSRQCHLTPRRRKAYKILRKSGVSLRAKLARCKSFDERLADAHSCSASPAFHNLLRGINLTTYRFFMCQLRNQNRLLKARRYTLPEKNIVSHSFEGMWQGI